MSSTDAERAANWEDVGDQNNRGVGTGTGPDSPEEVAGHKEKSKLSKAADVVTGPLRGAAQGNPGSSETADRLREGLKGGNPAT
ncbi:Hypothetical predicted protein [Lecanosticta acicola]|uniref:Uncharacterized protein n=1 Tax=Lecanosticta acicola TaxID=111012 RepID=A0AAI8YYF8_9PEZI|nr:Hypothetical predicted protein [Lecanosticta acicola]